MEVVTAVSAASATSNATAANAAPPIAAAAGAAAGQLRRKVLTLVFVRQGQQLLLGYKKRGFGAGRFNGFGGKVEAGETPRQGAARELLEVSFPGLLEPERGGNDGLEPQNFAVLSAR